MDYVYNRLGEREQALASSAPIPAGPVHLVVEFLKTGHDGPSPTGPVAFYVDDEQVAAATITVQPAYFSLSGEGTNIGRDRGQPVSSASCTPFELRGGTLEQVICASATTPPSTSPARPPRSDATDRSRIRAGVLFRQGAQRDHLQSEGLEAGQHPAQVGLADDLAEHHLLGCARG